MSCVLFIPQVQTPSGQWINVGEPVESFSEADNKRFDYVGNNRIIGFRVLQTSCNDLVNRSCCGR